MRFDLDPGKLLYAIGALFGIAAVLYFARDVVFDLSITVRAILLLFAFVALLVAAVATSRSGLDAVLYVLSAAAYLAFLAYTLSRFDVGADGTFLALLLSAGLFLGLGYLSRERGLALSPRAARYAVGGLVLTAVILIGVDMAVSGVVYSMTVHDEGRIDDHGEIELATVTAENRFVFREPLELSRPMACTYGFEHRDRPVQLRVGDDAVPDTIPGGGTITATVTTRFNPDEVEDVDDPIPIERASSCPEDVDGTRIVIVTNGDLPEPPR